MRVTLKLTREIGCCLISAIWVLSAACAPSVSYVPQQAEVRRPKPTDHEVLVFFAGDVLPATSKVIGTVKIGDTGFSLNCGLTEVIEKAKARARQVGADAIQIVKITEPDFFSTCYRITANAIAFDKPEDWPTISLTETEAREYFDATVTKQTVLEGIWNVSTQGTWYSVTTGGSGRLDYANTYRLAIVPDTTSSSFEYIGIILESQQTDWEPGFVKARFRSTAYRGIYEGVWYTSDFSEMRVNYTIEHEGLIKFSGVQRYGGIEASLEMYMIKAYPVLADSKQPFDAGRTEASQGTGFLVSNSGLVVTNFHVVKEAQEINVHFPERGVSKPAVMQIKDAQNDIAILQIQEFEFSELYVEPVPFRSFSHSPAKLGENVYTLGYPLGDILGSKLRFTDGTISATFGIEEDPRLYQISNPVQPGSSGGPLLTSQGELIGIVISTLSARYLYENRGIIPQNVNFAIKIEYLQNILNLLPGKTNLDSPDRPLMNLSMQEQVERISPYVVLIEAR